jgi:hypothetical protein
MMRRGEKKARIKNIWWREILDWVCVRLNSLATGTGQARSNNVTAHHCNYMPDTD